VVLVDDRLERPRRPATVVDHRTGTAPPAQITVTPSPRRSSTIDDSTTLTGAGLATTRRQAVPSAATLQTVLLGELVRLGVGVAAPDELRRSLRNAGSDAGDDGLRHDGCDAGRAGRRCGSPAGSQ